MKRVINFLKDEVVLIIASVAAIISMFFMPPSAEYLGYIDFAVIAILFCLMIIIAGFTKVGVFDVLSQKLLTRFKDVKIVSILLVSACFISAMFITNDVALLTFVPLTIGIIGIVSQKRLIFVLVMETVAANIGSMLTPIGNPQNLFLYSHYNIGIADFFKIVAPICAIGFIIILIFLCAVSSSELTINVHEKAAVDSKKQLAIYCVLFLLAILTVLHIVDYRISLVITVVTLLFVDRSIFKRVDYSLLFTFVAFFIFVGNLGRIPIIRTFVSEAIAGREFISSVLISQVISNVPAAIMLSNFTDSVEPLLLGVNVGGLGTLIASLASLISFRLYVKSKGAQPGRFFLVFTIINVVIAALLIGSYAIMYTL